MQEDARVAELLKELLDSGSTPEEVCRTCPELLESVRAGWQRVRALEAAIGGLFPEAPSTDPADQGRLRPSEHSTPDLPSIRGYEVKELLGRGGMGVIYKAWHLRLHRPVAVKMLLAGAHARPQELERFLREAETIAGLRHPNILQVHEAGDVDGRPYFTMELVEGGSLFEKLAGIQKPVQELQRHGTRVDSVQIRLPRLFFEISPSASTSKGFLIVRTRVTDQRACSNGITRRSTSQEK